jgi:lactoylglutathione lyase
VNELRAFPVLYVQDVERVAAFYVEPGPGPRHELFVCVEDVDATFARVREAGATALREPADMPWGERVAFVRDPEGNVVTLAAGQS